MSDQNRFGGALTDQEKEKIDRAAWHEQVQFLKKQQWAVATAGVVLFGAFLAIMRDHDMSPWEKYLAVLFIVVGAGAGCFFLDDLQNGLATVRRALDQVAIGSGEAHYSPPSPPALRGARGAIR
jgi:hypothetical protein